MRILVVVNDFPDQNNKFSANIFVKEQVRALSKYVEEITVVVPIPIGIEKVRKRLLSSYRNYEVEGNVKINFVRYFNPLFPISYYKMRDIWTYFESKAVEKFLKKEMIHFDLIHAHYTWPSGAVAANLKQKFGNPIVLTEHTSKTFQKYITSEKKLAIKVWRNCDAIIRVCRGDIKLIKELVNVNKKIYYIPNGFDSQKFCMGSKEESRLKLDLPIETKILLNVANFYSPIKGHEFLLKAYLKVHKSYPDSMLLLVGDGKLRPKIQKMANELGLSQKVLFTGAKPHEEIPFWMNAADIFVLPSLNEGNPTVMFEALGVGLPFIGTAVGGVPEIITSEDYGLLCKPGDAKDLAEKILIALEKEWDREKIRKYAEQFTWDNIAKQVVRVYEEVLK